MGAPTKIIVTLVGALLLTTASGRAGTIVFNDLTDTVSVTGTAGSRFTATCHTTSLFEACDVVLVSPVGPSGNREVIAGATPFPVQVAEPGGAQVFSDSVDSFSIINANTVRFTFHSELDGVVHPCVGFILPGCTLTETGSPLTVASIFWADFPFGSGFTEDVIQIASDVESSTVPEPTSLLLVGSGLLGVVRAARRKWLG